MATEQDFELLILEMNSTTGFKEWTSTLHRMMEWGITEQDIAKLNNGGSIKLSSPNGQRRLTISKIETTSK